MEHPPRPAAAEPSAPATPAPTGRAASEWRACVAAFTFLSRLPVSRWARYETTDLAAAVTYFPLVGLVIGAIGAAGYGSAALLWPAPIAVVLSVALTVWLTGAFHEDAAADAFDGFGGGWDRDQVLAIMKDSRVGSYALVGVVLLLAARLTALAAIAMDTGAGMGASAVAVAQALIAAHVLGRWSSAPLLFHYAYVRPTHGDGERASAGGPFAAGITRGRAVSATIIAFAIVAAALGWRAAVVIPLAVIVTAAGGRYAARRIGGVTGDVLGAVHQFVEVSVYLALAAHASGGKLASLF